MNGITFLDNDTIIVKVERLQLIIKQCMHYEMKRLEQRIEELIEDKDRIVHKKEVCEILDISPSTYDNWVRKGTLKSHLIGSKPYCLMSEIKAAMKPAN
ncbi:hypothetical protein [Chryseobacterium sp. R2A-55]|uniref:hypothetical protein n=1 Tax=Chryseobacterium sp. R2A-55 TaxID=2744445 RepID=UPI001F1F0DB0|nr:hypothetical protein [Chryseobacterium sp. R2A-55]